MKALKILFKILKFILTALVVLILIVVLAQRFTNTKVFGYGVYTVLTGSMEPEYNVGDILLAQEVKKEDIKVGDDVVYKGEVGDFEGKIVTHRIESISGETIVTKGIANSFVDPSITYDQIQAKVVRKLNILSVFSKLMNDNIMFYVIVFVPFGILIFLDVKNIVDEKKELEEEKNKDNKEEEQLTEPTTEVVEEIKEEEQNKE